MERQVDLWQIVCHLSSLFCRDQKLHHAELLVLLLPHRHELTSLDPAGLSLSALIHLCFLLTLLKVIKISELGTSILNLNSVCLLVVNALDSPSFHQI